MLLIGFASKGVDDSPASTWTNPTHHAGPPASRSFWRWRTEPLP